MGCNHTLAGVEIGMEVLRPGPDVEPLPDEGLGPRKLHTHTRQGEEPGGDMSCGVTKKRNDERLLLACCYQNLRKIELKWRRREGRRKKALNRPPVTPCSSWRFLPSLSHSSCSAHGRRRRQEERGDLSPRRRHHHHHRTSSSRDPCSGKTRIQDPLLRGGEVFTRGVGGSSNLRSN